MDASASTTAAPALPVSAAPAVNTPIEHDCMTAQELASWLRVDRKTVYEYAARNVIPCRRLGRRLVFLRSAVTAWLGKFPPVGAHTVLRR
jgi:excisionase family DNA binding protein